MPGRIVDIFDVSKTKAENRFKCIASCNYAEAMLNEAEAIRIREGSAPISRDQPLARVVESPSHADDQAKAFKDIAFAEAFKRGISVQQLGLTTNESIHAFGLEKVKRFNENKSADKQRTYLGYVVSLCAVFRDARATDGRRLFGVFSTPEDGAVSHADIFVVIQPGPGDKLAIQQRFHDYFKLSEIIRPSFPA
jgi:hypothetical protein